MREKILLDGKKEEENTKVIKINFYQGKKKEEEKKVEMRRQKMLPLEVKKENFFFFLKSFEYAMRMKEPFPPSSLCE